MICILLQSNRPVLIADTLSSSRSRSRSEFSMCMTSVSTTSLRCETNARNIEATLDNIGGMRSIEISKSKTKGMSYTILVIGLPRMQIW